MQITRNRYLIWNLNCKVHSSIMRWHRLLILVWWSYSMQGKKSTRVSNVKRSSSLRITNLKRPYNEVPTKFADSLRTNANSKISLRNWTRASTFTSNRTRTLYCTQRGHTKESHQKGKLIPDLILLANSCCQMKLVKTYWDKCLLRKKTTFITWRVRYRKCAGKLRSKEISWSGQISIRWVIHKHHMFPLAAIRSIQL